MNDLVKEEKLTTAEIAAARPRGEAIEKVSSRPPAARGYEEPPLPAPAEKATAERPIQLFSAEESQRFRSEWTQVQTGFVDEPRGSVEEADELVARVIRRLAEVFAEERKGSKRSGRKEPTSRPRIFGWRSSAIAPSSTASSRSEERTGRRGGSDGQGVNR